MKLCNANSITNQRVIVKNPIPGAFLGPYPNPWGVYYMPNKVQKAISVKPILQENTSHLGVIQPVLTSYLAFTEL